MEGEILNNREKTQVLRGDIYYADLNPVIGSEQGGVRPVLVIQNDVGNLYSPTVIIAAITSKDLKAEIPTHISVAGNKNGLKKESMVLLEQVRTIDRTRLKEYIGHLGIRSMTRINDALTVSLGLNFLQKERIIQNMKERRAWIYCRINEDVNNEMKLKFQEKRLREYAERNGLAVTGVSTDVCSGLVFERAGLDETLEAAVEDKMDVLLVLSVTHIGRDMIPTMGHIRKLLKNGVGVESVIDGYIDFVPYLGDQIVGHSMR
ncbi:MAG: hypothetical protein EOM59_06295 [Clostridia bacterium]|nr:hypothetical protein [Clostridia bacterium]